MSTTDYQNYQNVVNSSLSGTGSVNITASGDWVSINGAIIDGTYYVDTHTGWTVDNPFIQANDLSTYQNPGVLGVDNHGIPWNIPSVGPIAFIYDPGKYEILPDGTIIPIIDPPIAKAAKVPFVYISDEEIYMEIERFE